METKIWQRTNIQAFWGDVAASEHLVQIYENDRVFIDSLEGFAGTGLLAGNSVILVARSSVLHALDHRLRMHDFNLEKMILAGQYIPVDAHNSLASFMRNGMPDEKKFNRFCNELLSRAKNHSSHIRVFGEMVAILLEEGNFAGTLALENLWNKVCSREVLCLFCAYPQSSLHEHDHSHGTHICNSHTKVIGGWAKPSTEIFYRDSA